MRSSYLSDFLKPTQVLFNLKAKDKVQALEELLDVAKKVRNISAKHEGGVLETEESRKHPSDILEYFLPKKEIEEKGLMPALERNYMEKHRSVNRTADALLKSGTDVVCAWNLHK